MKAPIRTALLFCSCLAVCASSAQTTVTRTAPSDGFIVDVASHRHAADAFPANFPAAEAGAPAVNRRDVLSSLIIAPEASTVFLMGAGALVLAAAMRVNRSRRLAKSRYS